MPEVTVAIPTFRRPKGLARLLASLADLQTRANVTVLVGDNDADGRQGYELCVALSRSGYRWPLEAIVVAERGIAQNRNALAVRALASPSMQFVAMLDDDEWPHPDWLDALLRTQAELGADLVEGRVERVYEDPLTAGVLGYGGVARAQARTGLIGMPEATANLLLTRACLERLSPPYFDPAFALTGGEDTDFFVRLKRSGARFAWAKEALAYAYVPVSRTGLKWTLSRAYSNGNSDMRIFLKYRSGAAAMVKELGKVAGAFLLASAMALILAASPNRRVMALRTLWRAAGKTAALFGSHHYEYMVTHGD